VRVCMLGCARGRLLPRHNGRRQRQGHQLRVRGWVGAGGELKVSSVTLGLECGDLAGRGSLEEGSAERRWISRGGGSRKVGRRGG
jgi:hypothetical protein